MNCREIREDEYEHLPRKIYLRRCNLLSNMNDQLLHKIFRFGKAEIEVYF